MWATDDYRDIGFLLFYQIELDFFTVIQVRGSVQLYQLHLTECTCGHESRVHQKVLLKNQVSLPCLRRFQALLRHTTDQVVVKVRRTHGSFV